MSLATTDDQVARPVRRVRIDKSWTEAEDRVLATLYPDYGAMADVLRHRTYYACRGRCQNLKLVKPKHVWTTEENKRLTKLWRADQSTIMAALPGLAWSVIKAHAKDLQLPPRGAPPLVLTGDPTCDAIRDRCRELGYSMIYLDEIACTGTYFQKGSWRSKRGHKVAPMFKAIAALGGVIHVSFPD